MESIEYENQFGMYLNTQQMKCLELENAVILPRKQSKEGPMWGLGGVCDNNNVFVRLSEYHGGWAEHGGCYFWDKEQEEYCDDTVVYFGVFFNHWGHFLVDLVGRMWFFAQKKVSLENIKLAYIGEEDPVGNFKEFFELMGLDETSLLRITRPTRFKKVIVPEFSCRPCIWYTKEYLSIFECIINGVEKEKGSFPIENIPEKVYFSRQNFLKAKGSEFGENFIGKWMEANGYTLMSPESLSLRDQVILWNSAKQIACINGSIPINIAFSKNSELKLIVLNKTSFLHKNLYLYLIMRPCRVRFLDAYYEPFKKYPKSLGEGPFLLCINHNIKEFSAESGMEIPFSGLQIIINNGLNFACLLWSIINLKGKLRHFFSKIMPCNLKKAINRRKDK